MAELILTAPGRARDGHRMAITTRRVACALGRWTHSEARPPELAGIVERMGHWDGVTTLPRERTFPNGLLEIIVHLGERYRDVHGTDVSICPEVCVTGLQLGPMVVEAPSSRTAVLGIRLTVAGAYAVFGRPMHEAAGLTLDLRDLAGAAAVELQDRIGRAGDAAGSLAAAAAWISARLRRGIRADPAVAWALAEIERHAGSTSIARVREQAGLTVSRMLTAFREQVGVTPKQYARIIRFRHALEHLHSGASSLADAAVHAGYYDQPHMTAEFKMLSGLTPGEFLHARRYPNSVSIAEHA